MNHARNSPLELSLDRNDEALAADGDELILRTASFGEGPKRLSQALLDRAMLPLHCPPNPPKLRAGIVREASIRLDLPPEPAKKTRKIVPKQRRGERGDSRPTPLRLARTIVEQVAPSCDALDNFQKISNLERLKRRTVDARFLEQHGRIHEPVEVEAPTTREKRPQLIGPLLLVLDPGEVGRRLERHKPRPSERRKSVSRDVLAECGPLQSRRARLSQRGRNAGKQVRRGHILYRMRPRRHRLRNELNLSALLSRTLNRRDSLPPCFRRCCDGLPDLWCFVRWSWQLLPSLRLACHPAGCPCRTSAPLSRLRIRRPGPGISSSSLCGPADDARSAQPSASGNPVGMLRCVPSGDGYHQHLFPAHVYPSRHVRPSFSLWLRRSTLGRRHDAVQHRHDARFRRFGGPRRLRVARATSLGTGRRRS